MDTFSFKLPDGEATVLFSEAVSLPRFGPAGGIYVADDNTAPLLCRADGFDTAIPLVVLPSGESNKTLANVELILERALSSGLARDSVFVGFGGGVVTDMTAFAASVYMRGAKLELVPTTLLAMVDASVGGKTGVDFMNSKNCVGTFYPATKIHMPISALASLSEAEFRSGLAEVIKTALLYAPKLFQIMAERKDGILSRDGELMLEIVKRCVQAKAHVVERDLRESGERMYLNLGHTFGHALESVAGLGRVTHGEAVAWGIARALALGKRLGVTDEGYVADVLPVLESYGWSVEPVHPAIESLTASGGLDPADVPRALLGAMKNDKKKSNGRVRFILQREMNSTLATEVADDDVLAVLA